MFTNFTLTNVVSHYGKYRRPILPPDVLGSRPGEVFLAIGWHDSLGGNCQRASDRANSPTPRQSIG